MRRTDPLVLLPDCCSIADAGDPTASDWRSIDPPPRRELPELTNNPSRIDPCRQVYVPAPDSPHRRAGPHRQLCPSRVRPRQPARQTLHPGKCVFASRVSPNEGGLSARCCRARRRRCGTPGLTVYCGSIADGRRRRHVQQRQHVPARDEGDRPHSRARDPAQPRLD